MDTKYTLPHFVATAIGCAAIGYQTAVLWEAFSDVSLVTKLGIPLATVSAALLPVIGEAAVKQGERLKAAFFILPVFALIAFVLPSGISRLGEAQQAKAQAAVTSQADASALRSKLAQADRMVAEAQSWVASECRSGAGTKCKGVQYTLEQRVAFQEKLAKQVTTTTPATAPWLPVWHPALLPIGLELALWGCFFYGFGPLARRSADVQQALTFERPLTDKEIEEIIEELKRNDKALTNADLAEKLGISESECSKRVKKSVEAGLVSKVRDGRGMAITLH